MPGTYNPAAPRAERRRNSRRLARQQAAAVHRYNGTTPRYEPAYSPTCEQHHRKLPCKRCA